MLKPSPRLAARALNAGKITDEYKLITAKKAVSFDYVAVDVGSLVSGALRLTRAAAPTEQRRAKEVGRLVSQHLLQLLRRIQPTRSLLLAVDGAAPLWMAAATRAATTTSTRRVEARLARLPATPLMSAVEDRVVRMLPDARFGTREVVWCGTNVAGTAEEKITAWALDVAARENFDGTQHSLALVGGTDLYLNAWALTNHYRVSSIVERNTDLVQLETTALLAWLGLEDAATRGDNVTVARARTDTLFLHLLCHGLPSLDLGSVALLHLPHLFDQYQRLVLEPRQAARETEGAHNEAKQAGENPPVGGAGGDGGGGGGSGGGFLFEDVAGGALEMDVHHLIRLLGYSVRHTTVRAAYQPHVDDHLEHALQAHAQLCLGDTPDDTFVPCYLKPLAASHASMGEPVAPRPGVTATALLAHLLALVKVADLAAFFEAQSDPDKHVRRCARRRSGRAAYWKMLAASCQSRVDASSPSSIPDSAESMGTSPSAQTNLHDGGDAAPPVATSLSPTGLSAWCWSPAQPLTSAEATILAQRSPTVVEELLRHLVGVAPLPTAAQLIVQAPSIEDAHRRTQHALAFCQLNPPPRALCLGPSYCWSQRRQSKLWQMAYIDVGTRGREGEIRRRGNAEATLVLQSLSPRSGPQWFSAESQTWTGVPRLPLTSSSAGVGPEPTRPSPPTTLKLLTWNVMFDRYSGQPTPLGMPGIDWCSPQRYPVLANVMAREGADLIGMQEVEPAFLSFLAAHPFFREHYILSCGPESEVIAPWGVVLLVHKRLASFVGAIEHVNIPAWSGHVKLMPVVVLRLPHGTVHVAVAHLLAPFTKNNVSVRTVQDDVLRRYLTKTVPSAHDCVVMGDFNDWPGSEFVMPPATRYVECWPLLHPKDPGRTMDESNTFCKLKIEEIFFGRSDKVFLRSHTLKPVEAHLVGTKSVNEENGDDNAPAYLFPSDHYGVSTTFAVGST